MKMRRLTSWGLLALMVASNVAPVSACTGIRIKAKDGSVIAARTMEFATDLQSSVAVIPRGWAFTGSGPGGKPGLVAKTRYGYAGMNAFGLPAIVDGLNEKGLGVGVFYFPGYAGYQTVSQADVARCLAPQELSGYLLGQCASVAEALEAAGKVVVGDIPFATLGTSLPVHFVIHDAKGRSAVLEYVGGKLVVHDNPIGVVTNAPTFDWHITNLRNYVNLSITNVPTVELSGVSLTPLGQGSGMIGLPGDFTPPSRFVRAVALSQAAEPVASGHDGVKEAFHVLNHFDIPRGTVVAPGHGPDRVDSTQWTSAADLKNLRYHFHTEGNRQIRMVDLRKLDLDAKEVRMIPILEPEVFEDVTLRVK